MCIHTCLRIIAIQNVCIHTQCRCVCMHTCIGAQSRIECVLLLQNVFSYDRHTCIGAQSRIECVLLLQNVFSYYRHTCIGAQSRRVGASGADEPEVRPPLISGGGSGLERRNLRRKRGVANLSSRPCFFFNSFFILRRKRDVANLSSGPCFYFVFINNLLLGGGDAPQPSVLFLLFCL